MLLPPQYELPETLGFEGGTAAKVDVPLGPDFISGITSMPLEAGRPLFLEPADYRGDATAAGKPSSRPAINRTVDTSKLRDRTSLRWDVTQTSCCGRMSGQQWVELSYTGSPSIMFFEFDIGLMY
jgi:hypothetical protein